MLETIRKEEKENKQEELGIKKWSEKEKEKWVTFVTHTISFEESLR